MDKRVRNVAALGLVTIVAVVAGIWGVYFLMGKSFWESQRELVVAMSDAAGVKRGDRVVLQGVQVGTVSSVELTPNNEVVVILRVNDELMMPADTRATVTGDVFGAHVVELIPGKALVRLEDNDTIRGMAAIELMKLATKLSERADTILTSTQHLLDDEAVGNLHATAEALPATVRELRLMFAEMRGVVVEMRGVAGSLRTTTDEFAGAQTGTTVKQTLEQMQESARALTSAATSMDRSLQSFGSVMAKVDNGSGTIGRLVNDSSLYMQIHTTVRELGSLATDIRERPGRYISLKIF